MSNSPVFVELFVKQVSLFLLAAAPLSVPSPDEKIGGFPLLSGLSNSSHSLFTKQSQLNTADKKPH